MKPKIRKIQVWVNPTKVGKGKAGERPRWDAEIVRADGSRERIGRVSMWRVLQVVREAMQ